VDYPLTEKENAIAAALLDDEVGKYSGCTLRWQLGAGSSRRPLRFCHRHVGLTELAMKQFSWAAWCILSSSSSLGLWSPLHVIFGRSSTRVIAILPSAGPRLVGRGRESDFPARRIVAHIPRGRSQFRCQARARGGAVLRHPSRRAVWLKRCRYREPSRSFRKRLIRLCLSSCRCIMPTCGHRIAPCA